LNNLLEYLFSRQNLGIKLGLERTEALMSAVGDPHKKLRTVQVVGTNGKGSTAAFLASIFMEAGYKTGLSTSPHLVNVNERIRINGITISDEYIAEFIATYKADIEQTGSSFFEIITAMGFKYFLDHQVDIAIMETGLGGRLDSVTVCDPMLTLMTAISMDHMEILGDTIEKITMEKAGALKVGVPCLSSPQLPVVSGILNKTAAALELEIIGLNINQNHGLHPGILLTPVRIQFM